MEVDWDAYGKYATDLFTEEATRVIQEHNASQPLFLYLTHLAVHSGNTYAPVQAPSDIVELYSNIEDPKRRVFAGKIYQLCSLAYFKMAI